MDKKGRIWLILLFIGWTYVRFPTYPQVIDFMNEHENEAKYDFRSAKITTSFGDYILIYYQDDERI